MTFYLRGFGEHPRSADRTSRHPLSSSQQEQQKVMYHPLNQFVQVCFLGTLGNVVRHEVLLTITEGRNPVLWSRPAISLAVLICQPRPPQYALSHESGLTGRPPMACSAAPKRSLLVKICVSSVATTRGKGGHGGSSAAFSLPAAPIRDTTSPKRDYSEFVHEILRNSPPRLV